MSGDERERLETLAEDVKERALDLRGEADRDAAEVGLRQANERLAAAMVESAESDPELSEVEVGELREELARELERLAGGEIKASRGPGAPAEGGRTSSSPPADG